MSLLVSLDGPFVVQFQIAWPTSRTDSLKLFQIITITSSRRGPPDSSGGGSRAPFCLILAVAANIINQMKLTLQLQLLPDIRQVACLIETIERFNEAATWVADIAFQGRLANKFTLHKIVYYEIRKRFGLPADTAIRVIAQVVEAYKRDKSKKPRFKKHAAVPFSMGRNISFKGPDTVSISTLEGRVIVPFIMGKYQRERFGWAKGQSDLVLRKDGKWFLLVTVEAPDGTPIPTTDFIGVDLGVSQIAADSDGEIHSNDKIDAVRIRYAERRRRLDKAAASRKKSGKRPKAIRRANKRVGRRESKFRRDANHVISKRLVAKAKGTNRGIALEDLKGIRQRGKRFRRRERARQGSWAFFQLRSCIEYKGKLAGVSVVTVDPRDTSRTCAQCGHCEKANRKSQSEFQCRKCGHAAHADTNAARIIRARAVVNRPTVAEQVAHAA